MLQPREGDVVDVCVRIDCQVVANVMVVCRMLRVIMNTLPCARLSRHRLIQIMVGCDFSSPLSVYEVLAA
jgi:hypothetical protein